MAEITKQFPNGSYRGQLEEEQQHASGRGTMVFTNGDKYEGEWCRDEIEGRWVHTMPDGVRYDREWKADKIEGHWVFTWSDGAWYEGEWKAGQREGRRVFTKPWIMKNDEIKAEYLLDRAPDDLRKGWKQWIAEHGSGRAREGTMTRTGASAVTVIPAACIMSVFSD
jgi:hypothetical protein